jgi:hypothetical protein
MKRNIYYSNFQSCLRYGIILWGGDIESKKEKIEFEGPSNN